jgi:hypothetical protein
LTLGQLIDAAMFKMSVSWGQTGNICWAVLTAAGAKDISPYDFMPDAFRPAQKAKRTMSLGDFYREFVKPQPPAQEPSQEPSFAAVHPVVEGFESPEQRGDQYVQGFDKQPQQQRQEKQR